MAFTKSKHKSGGLVVRRHAPMVSKKKFEGLRSSIVSKKKKASEVAQRRMGALVGAAACGVVGYLEKTEKMPKLPGGIEPTVILGLAGLVLPEFVKGKAGQMIAEAGAALAGVAAYKLAAGAPLRVGEDDGEWSPA